MKIFPNPFSESLTIRNAEVLEDVILEIYSGHGKLVYSNFIPVTGEINLSNLENGLYILKVIQNNKTIYTQKALHLSS